MLIPLLGHFRFLNNREISLTRYNRVTTDLVRALLLLLAIVQRNLGRNKVTINTNLSPNFSLFNPDLDFHLVRQREITLVVRRKRQLFKTMVAGRFLRDRARFIKRFLRRLPKFNNRPFTICVRNVFTPNRVNSLKLSLITLHTRNLRFLIVTKNNNLRLISFNNRIVRHVLCRNNRYSHIVNRTLRIYNLLTSTVIRHLSTNTTFNNFFNIIPRRPNLSTRKLPFTTYLNPHSFHNSLVLTDRIRSTLRHAFTFVRFIRVNVFHYKLPNQYRDTVRVIRLTLVLITVLLHLNSFPVRLIRLANRQYSTVHNKFREFLHLLNFRPNFNTFNKFLVSRSNHFVTFNFNLNRLLDRSTILDNRLFSLYRYFISTYNRERIQLESKETTSHHRTIHGNLAILTSNPRNFTRYRGLLNFINNTNHNCVDRRRARNTRSHFNLYQILNVQIHNSRYYRHITQLQNIPHILNTALLQLHTQLYNKVTNGTHNRRRNFTRLVFPDTFRNIRRITYLKRRSNTNVLIRHINRNVFPTFNRVSRINRSTGQNRIHVALRQSKDVTTT